MHTSSTRKFLHVFFILKKVDFYSSNQGIINDFQKKPGLVHISKKRGIEDIFLGHHKDDLNETFFLRRIQQSSSFGLSNIFLDKYKSLKLHRPLKKYTKKQLKSYAINKRLIWFDDRSNLELDYTRNKIRNFLYSKKLFNHINNERLSFFKIFHLHQLHKNFFKRKRNNIFEIDTKKFNYLDENLKFIVVQTFYYEYRHLLKKQIRDENIKNFIKILKTHLISSKKMSVFSGKIGVFNKKTCINLT